LQLILFKIHAKNQFKLLFINTLVFLEQTACRIEPDRFPFGSRHPFYPRGQACRAQGGSGFSAVRNFLPHGFGIVLNGLAIFSYRKTNQVHEKYPFTYKRQ